MKWNEWNEIETEMKNEPRKIENRKNEKTKKNEKWKMQNEKMNTPKVLDPKTGFCERDNCYFGWGTFHGTNETIRFPTKEFVFEKQT